MSGDVRLLMDTKHTTSRFCVFKVTDSSLPNHHPDAEMATPHTRSTSQNMLHTHTLGREYTHSKTIYRECVIVHLNVPVIIS